MPKRLNNNLIVALDIGTSKVVAIVAAILQDGNLEIIGVGSHPSQGMKKGIVVNIDAIVQSIQRAVEEAEQVTGCQIHSVYTGIAGSHIRSINSHGIVPIKDSEVTAVDIDRVIEAAKAVAIPADQKILHVISQEFVIDKQPGIKEPQGISGVRLEANVHLITASVSAAQNIVNCIRRCSLEVDDITLEQLAASYAVLTEDEKNLGVCLLDIGSGTTDIAVFTNGAIRYTASLPVAGDQVTNDLAVALRTTTEAAERIKLKHGCALIDLADENQEVEVAKIGASNAKIISQFDLAHIIEPRYEELFALVRNELNRVGLAQELGAGLVLTGGSCRMNGVLELAENVFKAPVRLGVPQNIHGLTDVLKNPIYATGVGLLLHSVREQYKLRDKKFQRGGVSIHSVVARIKHWFQGNF